MTITNIARWAVLGALFLIPFLALYVSNSMYFPFITGKNFAFRALVEIAFMGWVVLAIADRRYRPQFSWVMVSFVLLVAWMALADALAVNPHKAFWSNFERMDGWVTLIHLLALFVVAGSVLTADKLWRKWWMTFITVVAYVSAHGLFQLFGWAAIHQSDTRIDASLGNSEYFAGFLLLALGITVWQALLSKGKGLRYSLLALAAIEVILLLGTGTRGTFVAAIAAAAVGGFLWLVTQGGKGRKGAFMFLAAMLVVVGGFYAARNTAVVQGSPNLARFADISLASLETRFTIWNMAVEGIKERPVTGWGHEGFNHVFNTHYNPSLYGQESWFDRAHNVYLDWAIAGGIPALLLFLLLGGTALVAVYRSKELKGWERVVITTTFIGYAIQGLAVFDNLFTYIPVIMLLAYAHQLRSRPVALLDRAPAVRGAMLEVVAAPVAAVVAVLLLYMVNVPTYAAGKEVIQGLGQQNAPDVRLNYFRRALAREPFASQEIREQLLAFAHATHESRASDTFKAESRTFAMAEMEKEIARTPQDARLYSLYGSFLRGTEQYDRAREVTAKARELSPAKQAIMLEQGLVEWQAGNPAAARAFFDEAYASSPHEGLVVYAAVGRIITGDVPGGKALLVERLGTSTVNHVALALAFQQAKAWPELIALLTKRYADAPSAIVGYQLASAYVQAGRFAEARTTVRTVMAAYPASAAQGTKLLTQLGAR
ncbi:MAG TPA: O-antigen ligase family protein [Candidatus Paceibacterota bacterium]|jgi:O-antigen ligase/tetratricopeptide (TPR) repeat protein